MNDNKGEERKISDNCNSKVNVGHKLSLVKTVLVSAEDYARFAQYQTSLMESTSVTTFAESGKTCLITSSNKWVIDSGATNHMTGDVVALGWWDLFINYGVAQCFGFMICTKWYNPAIHRRSSLRNTASSSTSSMRYLSWNSGFLASLHEDDQQNGICSLQDIGGHVMKIPLVCFQILLVMRLAGTPPSARFIPIPALFIPLFLLQGAGLLFSVYRLVETIILLVDGEAGVRSYFRMSSVIRDSFSFMRHGSRLLGWWSIDEGSREEQARLYYAGTSGYNTFSPDTVKQMPRAKLAEEIWRLQAALCEQSEITQIKQDEFERLQNEKILCRICFEEHINILLLPCRHHVLCSTCCDKCKRCPICRVSIEERLPVNDV